MKPKPNLFEFATSELSQDAMLCWLAAWGDPESEKHDQHLHQLGKTFLNEMFKKSGRPMPVIQKLEIKRQHNNIDVLIIINDTIAICIEDKVGTTEHSNQLERYLDSLKGDAFSTRDQILPIYIQTGEQGSYRSVKEAGYGVMRRNDLITLLHSYLQKGGEHPTVLDFHDHLGDIEASVRAFQSRRLEGWADYAWQGFYSEIQHQLSDGEWGYVPNPSGGFYGFWWHSHTDAESDQYLQIEQGKQGHLCFKIGVSDATKQSDLRSKWMDRILEAGRKKNLPIVRPQRLGRGYTMTVAIFDGEFRSVDNKGLIDMESTLRILRTAADVLDQAINSKAS